MTASSSSFQTLTYAGHSAVFLNSPGTVVAIDPWLVENPRCPSSLKSQSKLDLIILTHGHIDHAGDAVALAKQTRAKIAATYELAMIMAHEGVPDEQVLPMNKGGALQVGDVTIILTHALHSSSYDSRDRGTIYAGEACGVIVSDGKYSVYHAGDTSLFQDMKLIGERYRPDVALLPIGDRFTMGPVEAAQAAALVGPKLAVPIHYATFPLLTGDPQIFTRECEKVGVATRVIEPGASLEFTGLPS